MFFSTGNRFVREETYATEECPIGPPLPSVLSRRGTKMVNDWNVTHLLKETDARAVTSSQQHISGAHGLTSVSTATGSVTTISMEGPTTAGRKTIFHEDNKLPGVGSYNLDDSKRRHIAGIKLTAQKTKTRKDPSIDETQLGPGSYFHEQSMILPSFNRRILDNKIKNSQNVGEGSEFVKTRRDSMGSTHVAHQPSTDHVQRSTVLERRSLRLAMRETLEQSRILNDSAIALAECCTSNVAEQALMRSQVENMRINSDSHDPNSDNVGDQRRPSSELYMPEVIEINADMPEEQVIEIIYNNNDREEEVVAMECCE